MWPRKRFDIRLRDILAGITYSVRPMDAKAARDRLERLWSASGEALACLSVRSGFDLLWQSLALPPGSEVLITALNIPHMAAIMRVHGLIPVPVDVDLETLGPNLDQAARLVGSNTRAFVVAHLFGGRIPMEAVGQFAADHKLLLVEDCAQAFAGLDFVGHPQADVSMFSFGSIKTATALGGALFTVRNPALLARMRELQSAQPVQSRRRYLWTLLKYAFMTGICRPLPFGLFVQGCRLGGFDYDRIIHNAVRGFPGTDWLERIRHQPCTPLLAMLYRRLKQFNQARLADRAAKGELLLKLFGDRVFCPGRQAGARTHWVFPILADCPGELTQCLQQAGFDAARTHSLAVIDPPADRSDLKLDEVRRLMDALVCLPLYPEMPERAVRQMARVVLEQGRLRPLPVPKAQAVG